MGDRVQYGDQKRFQRIFGNWLERLECGVNRGMKQWYETVICGMILAKNNKTFELHL